MIRAVLFDFGGVLTESGKKGFIRQTIAELYRVPLQHVHIGDLYYKLRCGTISDEAFFAVLNARYHGNATKEMFVAKTQATLLPSHPVTQLAERLRANDIKTGILSNVFAMNARELRKCGYYDTFNPVVLSCEEGYAKPDKVFYEIALEKLGERPQHVLFIDDQSECLPPAKALGMHTILAEAPGQIVSAVQNILYAENGIRL